VSHVDQESIRGVGEGSVAENKGATEKEIALLQATDRGFDSREGQAVERKEAEELPGGRNHGVVESQVRTGVAVARGRGGGDRGTLGAM
jgi:hypothetical protein